MDPRQSLSRTASSNIQQQSPYNNPNMSAYAGTMPPQPPYGSTHLPPINSNYSAPQHLPAANASYMPQPPFRDNIPRYAQNPSPAGTPDSRYPTQMTPQQSMNNMPQNAMLPQPTNQTPQPQTYTTQPGTRPNSYPQPLAPAPPRPSMNDPYGAYGQPAPDRPWTGAEQIPGMTTDLGRDPTRTHVVGSQGRRGILPSAPGRPPVIQNGLNGSPKGNTIPQKDADGKFPCPSCTKTYLHAKHLKRHMLRHTGDRPYMCVLCTDTFSRSDILKRHFQKCSVRRGNPTGASHLSNPAAHLKKSQAAAQKAAAAAASAAQSPANQPNNSSNTPASSGAAQPSPYATTMPGSSMPTTTASLPAMNAMPYANGQNESKPHIPHQGQSGLDQSSNANWAMHNGRGNQMMYNSNTASPAQGGHHDDWNHFLPQTGNDNPYLGYGYEAHAEVKNETHESGANGYYVPSTSLGADGTLGPPKWHFTVAHESHLRFKLERLVDFCFPSGIQESLQELPNNDAIRLMLTNTELFRHFLELHQNYQGHFPWLHLPTFDIFTAYDGLLLTMICSGAVYSDRVSQTDVRELVLLSKTGIQRTSHLLRYHPSKDVISPTKTELEELQALLLAQNILTWHGRPEQRVQARNESRRLLQLVRQCRLLTLAAPGQEAYSYLHNLRSGEPIEHSRWNWDVWLLQEQRLRLVFLAVLFDAALTLFFNCSPEFQQWEIRLPLPCDDAAWDAPDSSRCASALGLYGPHNQVSSNVTGSQRPRQIDFDRAYYTLQESVVAPQPRETNAYGKFILIHALHVEIWQLQREQSHLDPESSMDAGTEAVKIQSKKRAISLALERWKQCWDTDMQLQYPSVPGVAAKSRGHGFCRDGIHFFWLAKAFTHPNRMNDWKLAADVKLRLFLRGLQNAREWSLSDGAQRGQELGSVADIDPSYETEETEFDMRKLFRPLLDV